MRSAPIRLFLPLLGLGLVAPACQAPLDEDVEPVPESASPALPGSTDDISGEADPYLAVYRFEGRFTPGEGFEFEPARLENDGLRTADQPLWCGVNVVQDGVPNAGPVDSFELVGAAAPLEGPDCFHGGYPTASPLILAIYQARGAICQSVVLRSFYDTESFTQLYAVIDLLTPATGYNGYVFPLGTGAEPPTNGPNFPNASRGLWYYGDFAPRDGAPFGPDEAAVVWTLENAGGPFTFSGRVVAAFAETCGNSVDDDCDGSIDDGCQQFALGAVCTNNLDCASANCDTASSRCAGTTCGDGVENGTETDLDCGGLCAADCVNGLGCNTDGDCQSGICFENSCYQYRRPLPGELIITEFMPNPTGDDTAREWIEITNPSATTFSLQGCVLTDVDATESYTIPVEVLSNAGSRILIGRSSDTALNGGLTMAHANVAAFNLGNSGDSIVLRCGSQVVDSVSYTLDQVREKSSTQLSISALTTVGNDDAANLCLGVAAIANGDFGTPAAANVTCALSNISCIHNSPTGSFGAVVNDVLPATVAIRVPGITDQTAGANGSPLIEVQIGVGPLFTPLDTLDDVNWLPASLQAGFSSAGPLAGYDRYGASATMPSVGGSTLKLGFRVRGDSSAPWIYCDTGAGSADGFDDALVPRITVQAAAPAPVAGDFLVTEILVDGNAGGASESNEFVEFRNVSGGTRELNGCLFGDDTVPAGVTTSVQIPADGYVLLAKAARTFSVPGSARVVTAAAGFDLSNSAADYGVMRCGGVEIARLDFTTSGTAGVSRTLPPERQTSAFANQLSGFCNLSALNSVFQLNGTSPFDYGTPGRDNPGCALLGDITECYVNVGSPSALTVQTVNAVVGTSTTIGARVLLPGLTDSSNGLDADFALVGQIGYGPTDTDPSIDFNAYTWTVATGTGGSTVGEDQYDAAVTAPAAGTYAIAGRFSLDGGNNWTYCDTKEEAPQEFSLALLDSFVTTAPPTLAACDTLFQDSNSVYPGAAASRPSLILWVPGITDMTGGLDLSSLVTVSHAWWIGATPPAIGDVTWTTTTTEGAAAPSVGFDSYLAPALTVPDTTPASVLYSVFRVEIAGGGVHYCGNGTPHAPKPFADAVAVFGGVNPYVIVAITSNGSTLSTVEGSRLALSANLLVPDLTNRSTGSEESPLVTVEHSFVPTGNAASWSAAGVTFDTTYAASNSDTRYTLSLLAPRATGAYDSQFRACYNGGSCMTSAIRTITLTASPVWINEVNFHASGATEGVEIAGVVGTNLAGYTLVYRDSSGAASGADLALTGTLNSATSGVGLRFFSRSGLAAAGHALLVSPAGAVVDHLSWGPGITGQPNGPASVVGSVATHIPFLAFSPATVGRTGNGCSKAEFSTFASMTFSNATLNAGQTATCAPPVLPPVDSCSATFAASAYIGAPVTANVSVTLASVTDVSATVDALLEIESQLLAATALTTEPASGFSTVETFVAQVGAAHTYTVASSFPEASPVAHGYVVRARYAGGPWTYCYADGLAPGTYNSARVPTATPTSYGTPTLSQQAPSATSLSEGTTPVTYTVRLSATGLTDRTTPSENSGLVELEHSVFPAAGSPTWTAVTPGFDVSYAASNPVTQYTSARAITGLAAGTYTSRFRVRINGGAWVESGNQTITVSASFTVPTTVLYCFASTTSSGTTATMAPTLQSPTSANASLSLAGGVSYAGISAGGTDHGCTDSNAQGFLDLGTATQPAGAPTKYIQVSVSLTPGTYRFSFRANRNSVGPTSANVWMDPGTGVGANLFTSTIAVDQPSPPPLFTSPEFTVSSTATYLFQVHAWGATGGVFSLDSIRIANTAEVLIPAGTFLQGGPGAYENAWPSTLTRNYVMQTSEVTQAQWVALSGGTNPACFQQPTGGGGGGCTAQNNGFPTGPVERVDWYSALAYANALSVANGLTACYTLIGCADATNGWKDGVHSGCGMATFAGLSCNGYRLPTESEWERAARGGTTTLWFWGDSTAPMATFAWTGYNAAGRTQPVRTRTANAYGLFDMSGNVWEWVWDSMNNYPGPSVDYLGPGFSGTQVFRGGSCVHGEDMQRSARRLYRPIGTDYDLGFRLVRTL